MHLDLYQYNKIILLKDHLIGIALRKQQRLAKIPLLKLNLITNVDKLTKRIDIIRR